MTKAEERALEAYPIKTTIVRKKIAVGAYEPYEIDENSTNRQIYIKGYEQAKKDLSDIAAFSSGIDGFYYGRGYQQGKKDSEKDLALTWEDVKEIVRIADTMMDFDPHNRPEWMESDKAYYGEILKRFKETKQ